MKTPLPMLLLLCACAGSLVDHAGASLSGSDAGTAECQRTCTDVPPGTPAGTTPHCDGSVCTYQCPSGQFKAAGGCRAASEISAGASHTCAVVAGEARCWGANDKGQLGSNLPAAGSFVPTAPTALTGVSGTVDHIAAGAGHTCAIVNGDVWCWGDNSSGQLGNGTRLPNLPGVASHVENVSGAQFVVAGGAHTCAANASKTFCWGNNDLGQLGDGASIPEAGGRPEATEVPGAAGALALGAGQSHTCAVAGSSLVCWGANDKGQLGINSSVAALSTPTSVGLSPASFLGLGWNHSCAGQGDSLSCWGANGAGQVDNSLQDQRSPRGVLSNVLAVVGGERHTCAVTKGQGLRCWGFDGNGQLGAAGQSEVTVALTNVTAAAAGAQHTCAIAGGTTLCWGLNQSGQLGADLHGPTSTATPTPISGL